MANVLGMQHRLVTTQVGDHGSSPVFFQAVDHYAGSFGYAPLRNGFTDASGAAGDDDDFIQ